MSPMTNLPSTSDSQEQSPVLPPEMQTLASGSPVWSATLPLKRARSDGTGFVGVGVGDGSGVDEHATARTSAQQRMARAFMRSSWSLLVFDVCCPPTLPSGCGPVDLPHVRQAHDADLRAAPAEDPETMRLQVVVVRLTVVGGVRRHVHRVLSVEEVEPLDAEARDALARAHVDPLAVDGAVRPVDA